MKGLKLTVLLGLLAGATATVRGESPVSSKGCAVPLSDKIWIDKTVKAWRYASTRIARIPRVEGVSAIFFSKDCKLTSDTALFGTKSITWESAQIFDYVPLPGDEGYPITVVSRTQSVDNKSAFYLMSTPTIWRAANVEAGKSFDLETLMTAVMLHEAIHVSQSNTYFAQFMAISKSNKLAADWFDDGLQARYGDNVDFSDSIDRETEMLFAAAYAPSDATAIELATKARRLMQERRTKYYHGNDAIMAKIEDIWLTMEGSGQWVAYKWLIDKRGGGVAEASALREFGKRGKWWSQKQGLAITLITDRLDQGAWRGTAFGNGGLAGVELLDEALANTKKKK